MGVDIVSEMVRTFKYQISAPDIFYRCRTLMPKGSKPVSVGIQEGEFVVWATVPSSNTIPSVLRTFVVVNTGTEFAFNQNYRFLGTVTSENGIVWHVWSE